MRILVLDDRMLLVKDIIRDVKKIRPEAECFGFHKESDALEFAKNHPLDVGLLDINMPNMNGITVAKKLQQYHPKINLIFLTAYPEYALESYDVFSSGFLVKPLEKDKLQKLFDNLRYPIEDCSPSSSKKYDMAYLGAKIKKRRNELKLTAEDLAEMLDVSVQTVYRWESGERKPDSGNLIRIANTLGIQMEYLMSDSDT